MTQNKDKNLKLILSSIIIVTLLFLSFMALNRLIYVNVSIESRWILIKTASGFQISENPKLFALRVEELGANLASFVTPEEGFVIPVDWGDLGKQLVEKGVIDKEQFYALYEKRGGLTEYEKQLLEGGGNKEIIINAENANTLLNFLWALGLANKNRILEDGPMVDTKYGGDASKFASTGGWTLSKGDAMDHYSKYGLVVLTEEQQKLVETVSKNIYRPCCGNSTYFPDCNHGMAMLGLMELMASQGASEQEMYDTALAVNSFWFPDTYITIGKYFAQRGVSWEDIDAKEVLSSAYSSAQGYSQVARVVEPSRGGGGGSCGV